MAHSITQLFRFRHSASGSDNTDLQDGGSFLTSAHTARVVTGLIDYYRPFLFMCLFLPAWLLSAIALFSWGQFPRFVFTVIIGWGIIVGWFTYRVALIYRSRRWTGKEDLLDIALNKRSVSKAGTCIRVTCPGYDESIEKQYGGKYAHWVAVAAPTDLRENEVNAWAHTLYEPWVEATQEPVNDAGYEGAVLNIAARAVAAKCLGFTPTMIYRDTSNPHVQPVIELSPPVPRVDEATKYFRNMSIIMAGQDIERLVGIHSLRDTEAVREITYAAINIVTLAERPSGYFGIVSLNSLTAEAACIAADIVDKNRSTIEHLSQKLVSSGALAGRDLARALDLCVL